MVVHPPSPAAGEEAERLIGPHLLDRDCGLSTPEPQCTSGPLERAASRHSQQWKAKRESEMSAICMELSAVRLGRGSAHAAAVRPVSPNQDMLDALWVSGSLAISRMLHFKEFGRQRSAS